MSWTELELNWSEVEMKWTDFGESTRCIIIARVDRYTGHLLPPLNWVPTYMGYLPPAPNEPRTTVFKFGLSLWFLALTYRLPNRTTLTIGRLYFPFIVRTVTTRTFPLELLVSQWLSSLWANSWAPYEPTVELLRSEWLSSFWANSWGHFGPMVEILVSQ